MTTEEAMINNEPAPWRVGAQPSTTSLSWAPVWSAGGAAFSVEAAPTPGGDWHRVRSGEGTSAGAVAVVTYRDDDGMQVLLVRQERPVPEVTLWELPRGSAEPDDHDSVQTALRELAEETGISAPSGTLIGSVYPDSGLLASAVAVVWVQLDARIAGNPSDGEVDHVAWFDFAAVANLIANAQLRDGISMAALLLVQTRWRA